MEQQINELIVLHAQFLQQQQLLQETSQQVSKKLQNLGLQFDLDVSALENSMPEHVSTQWAADYLEIDRSNFYRNVRDILLCPVLYIGIRPYYLKQEVIALMVRHEKGAHTWSRLAKMAKKKMLPRDK